MSRTAPQRRFILVVEDEGSIAVDIEMAVEAAGWAVLGPFDNPDEARMAIVGTAPVAAVLDVALGEQEVFALADELARREVPFVFVTARKRSSLPLGMRSRPLIEKPYEHDDLILQLRKLLAGAAVPEH